MDEIERYEKFSLGHNLMVATVLYNELKATKIKAAKKIFGIRIYFELLQAVENTIRLYFVCQKRKNNNFWELMTNKKFDDERLDPKNLEKEYKKFAPSDPHYFVNNFLKFSLSEREYVDGKKAIDGIFKGIISAFENRLVKSSDGVESVLVKVYNKIKHGFTILDSSDDNVEVFLSPSNYKTISVNEKRAEKWLGTIEAMMNTQRNILSLIKEDRVK